MKITIEIPDAIFDREPLPEDYEKRGGIAAAIAFGLFDNYRECLAYLKAWNLMTGTKGWERGVEEISHEAAEEARRAAEAWEADTEAGQAKRARAKRKEGEARS